MWEPTPNSTNINNRNWRSTKRFIVYWMSTKFLHPYNCCKYSIYNFKYLHNDWLWYSISISKTFYYCAGPYGKTDGTFHSHYIMCYSEQYARLKRNVFSPRRKADVDCVLFSSVGSWSHALTAAVENAGSAVLQFVHRTGMIIYLNIRPIQLNNNN